MSIAIWSDDRAQLATPLRERDWIHRPDPSEDGFTCYPPFSDGVCRWGDYSAGAVNNVDQTSWTATEYVPDINRSSQANWATYVTRFRP